MLSIHLGAHKTASTHLQLSLWRARDHLGRGGVFYAGPSVLRCLPLAAALESGEPNPSAEECRRELACMAANHPHLLLSDENILGGTHRNGMALAQEALYPFALRRVRQLIAMTGRGPATLFLSLRDPASFTVSAFALQVMHGNETDFSAYLGGRDPARVGWAGLVQRLAMIETVARIVVWRYEDYRALRPQLLRLLVGSDLAGMVSDPPPRNVSLSQPGYDWLLAQAATGSADDLQDLAREARDRFRPGRGHPPLRLLGTDDHARSARHYDAEVARLRSIPKVEFLAP